MPKLGRPAGSGISNRKLSITRAISLPGELYKKCIWIADRWTREALVDSEDGTITPEYWSVAKVISSVLAEFFQTMEAKDPEITKYFENCRERDAKAKSISKAKAV